MKIYEADGCGGLVNVTANRNFLSNYTSSNLGIFIHERADMLVLVKSPERGAWLTKDSQRVDLYNTHATGELRWHEPLSAHADGFRHLAPSGLAAAKFFELTPFGIDAEKWKEIQQGYLMKLEDFSEVEVAMLRNAKEDPDHSARILTEERVKGEDGEWVNTVKSTPEGSAIYDLQRKGLLVMTLGSHGTGFGDRKNIWQAHERYRITQKARDLLEKGSA